MKYPPHCRRAVLLALSMLAAGVLGAGCQSSKKIVEGPIYPEGVQRGPTLNIQVFRRETELEFTNTTAEPIPKSMLWLNAWYSREFDGLGVGQTVVIPLSQFKDRYGDSFRGGGFFATELPERLGLAEVQTEGKMVGLVVVGGEGQ